MEEEPKSNGDNRPNGTFAEGNPGGPGRPKGSVSIVARTKAKFEEDPEYFEEWISKLLEDPSNRKAVMEQIDGKTLAGVIALQKKHISPSVGYVGTLTCGYLNQTYHQLSA